MAASIVVDIKSPDINTLEFGVPNRTFFCLIWCPLGGVLYFAYFFCFVFLQQCCWIWCPDGHLIWCPSFSLPFFSVVFFFFVVFPFPRFLNSFEPFFDKFPSLSSLFACLLACLLVRLLARLLACSLACSLACLALPCLALPCLALPCLALPCLALPCLALPCLALPCLAGLPPRARKQTGTKQKWKKSDGKSCPDEVLWNKDLQKQAQPKGTKSGNKGTKSSNSGTKSCNVF